MSRALIAVALFAFASIAAAEEDPFYQSVKVGDVVAARVPEGGEWWRLSLIAKEKLTDDNKRSVNYYEVKAVTSKALLVQTLSGKTRRWIAWHAISDVNLVVEEAAANAR